MFDMTTQEFFRDIPLSNYRVGYFKVLGWEEGKAKDITDISKAVVLEICLIPEHNAINQLSNSDDPNVLLTVPSGSKLIRVKAGDYWPYLSDLMPLDGALKKKARRNDEDEDFWDTPAIGYDEKL